MINALEKIPYKQEMMGNRKLVDEKHLLIMQIALQPGQSVPGHNANSNVHLLILEGNITLTLDGKIEHCLKKGDLLPVAFKTPMNIENTGDCNATFLVLKTPNPSEMLK